MASLPLHTPPDDTEALVLRYRPLARHLAQRYVRSGEQREDLEQVAYLGLVKAARRFDPRRGTAFTTFAMPTVLGELRRYCRDTRCALHVPRPVEEHVQTLRRFEETFQGRSGRSPSTAEAATALGWSEEDVLDARMAATTLSPQSLNAPLRSADGTVGEALDSVGEEDLGYAGAEQRDALQRALITLSPPARSALRLRGELDLSTPEIARRMGLSTSQAGRLIGAALRDLRAALAADDRAPVDGPGPASTQVCAEPVVQLVDADPELFARLSVPERRDARRLAVAPALTLAETGPAALEEAAQGDGPGLLVVCGALMRTVSLERQARAEMIGPGDLIRPRSEDIEHSLPARSTWDVVQPTRLAVIDTSVLETLCRWPSVVAQLLARSTRRSHELVRQLTITDLRRVDDRIMTLVWSLADRWGRCTPDGVSVPLRLTHDDIARLVGAHRPTVTSALRRLEGSGRLRRRAEGGWLLAADAPAPGRTAGEPTLSLVP